MKISDNDSSTNTPETNYVIIGAGLLGIMVARELKKLYPEAQVHIFEKGPRALLEMSAKHSALVHNPLYYRDANLTRWVAQGREELLRFCQEQGISVWPIKAKYQAGSFDLPVVALEEFNKALFKESEALGVKYHFNINYRDLKRPEKSLLINCAGASALEIANSHQLATDFFQVNFQQLHYVDSRYQDPHHLFTNIENEQLPMFAPHWIHSPNEGVVKYGPFLRPLSLWYYLRSPVKSTMALIILARQFGLKRLSSKLVATKRMPLYPKRPKRHLIFCQETLEVLDTPQIFYSALNRSWHVLNYHSPGFTMGFAFAKDLVKKISGDTDVFVFPADKSQAQSIGQSK